MDIFEFAIQMEKDGEQYYRELAGKTKNTGIQNILEMLASEEQKHARAIEAVRQEASELAETDVLNHAKNVFQRMKEYGEEIEVNTSEPDLYRKAMEIEQKSIDFYLDRADQVEQSYQKELFLKLVEEEKKHYSLMENLAEFSSQPEHWLENAEFFHEEDY